MIQTRDDQTIIAQCTPKGNGAIALLRISGDDALAIATSMACLASGALISMLPTHTIHMGWVVDHEQQKIDQVMFLLMHAPRTFTGQHVVEITCHNNQFIVESIIQRAIQCGARLAQEGEFTKRAFLHGKLDLLQAEAINEIINANSQMALKQSLGQLEGSFSHWLLSLERSLIKALALSEASFEFLDEEMSFGDPIKELLKKIIDDISYIKIVFNQQQQIRQGVKIALIGSVNAGKSSLFNALIGHKRAIVTSIAGTTRDAIEAGLYKDGMYWTLIDTAGLRQTDDIIEQEGIERSYQEAHKADIILMVYDGSRIMTQQEHDVYQKLLSDYEHKIIIIHNKADLPEGRHTLGYANLLLRLSTTNQASIDQLHSAIQQKINELFSYLQSPFLLNKRQYTIIMSLEQKLHAILEFIQGKNIAYELLSYHLKDALELLTELTGKTISEKGMDAVFREFCVGK